MSGPDRMGDSRAATPGRSPEPQFTVLGAEPVRFAAAPAIKFRLSGEDASGADLFTIALSVQLQVEPGMRTYDPESRARLVELFGDPERWSATTKPIAWTRVGVLVPSFRDSVEFEVVAPLSYDLDVGFAKYFAALTGGEIPISFHFSGSVIFHGAEHRVQLVQVPWAQTTFRMPVTVWREAIAEHFPDRAWIGVRRETVDRLQQYKAALGLTSLDEGLVSLLAAAEDPARAAKEE